MFPGSETRVACKQSNTRLNCRNFTQQHISYTRVLSASRSWHLFWHSEMKASIRARPPSMTQLSDSWRAFPPPFPRIRRVMNTHLFWSVDSQCHPSPESKNMKREIKRQNKNLASAAPFPLRTCSCQTHKLQPKKKKTPMNNRNMQNMRISTLCRIHCTHIHARMSLSVSFFFKRSEQHFRDRALTCFPRAIP